MAIGEEHLYRITLAAGQYAEVIVEQRGIDVVVQARREGGTDHVEFQEEVRRDGQERVEVVADDGGAYILADRTQSRYLFRHVCHSRGRPSRRDRFRPLDV